MKDARVSSHETPTPVVPALAASLLVALGDDPTLKPRRAVANLIPLLDLPQG